MTYTLFASWIMTPRQIWSSEWYIYTVLITATHSRIQKQYFYVWQLQFRFVKVIAVMKKYLFNCKKFSDINWNYQKPKVLSFVTSFNIFIEYLKCFNCFIVIPYSNERNALSRSLKGHFSISTFCFSLKNEMFLFFINCI